MDSLIPADIKWVQPWEPVDKGGSLDAELRRELIEGHPLFGLPATAVARRVDCDDVLFSLDHPTHSFAVVHLTWRMKPETVPGWPSTRLYRDVDHWMKDCMLPDSLKDNREDSDSRDDKAVGDTDLEAEVCKLHSAGTKFSGILNSYTDPKQRLTAANILARLPDLHRARRLRLAIWLVALCFAAFALMDTAIIITEGITLWLAVSLLADGAICVCLFRRQLWGFLSAPGWLLITAVANIRALVVNDLSAEEETEYVVSILVLAVIAAFAYWLKRLTFPYHGLRGPKLDHTGKPLILRTVDEA